MFTTGFQKLAALSRAKIIDAALNSQRFAGVGASTAHRAARDLADEYVLARATGKSMGKHLQALHKAHPKTRPGFVAQIKKLLSK